VAVEPKMERKEITTTAAGFDFAIEFWQLLAQGGSHGGRLARPVTGAHLPRRGRGDFPAAARSRVNSANCSRQDRCGNKPIYSSSPPNALPVTRFMRCTRLHARQVMVS
jgi:hypothetical protein